MRLGVSCLLIVIAPVLIRAQADGPGDSRPVNDGPISVIDITDRTHRTSEMTTRSAPVEYSAKSIDWDSYQRITEMIEVENVLKKGYVATVDVARLLTSGKGANQSDPANIGILLGIKRPYYRLGRDSRVAGMIDFTLKGSLAGIENCAVFTLGYDLKKYSADRSLKMDMTILNISFKISLPLNFP